MDVYYIYICRMLKREIASPPVATHRVIQVLRQEEQRTHWFMTCIFFIKWRFVRHSQGPIFQISSTLPQPHLHELKRETIGGKWTKIHRLLYSFVIEFVYLYNLHLYSFLGLHNCKYKEDSCFFQMRKGRYIFLFLAYF